MRLVDMMMDYATCTVFRGQTSSMHSYRGHVTADSCYRGLYYTYIPVVSEAMTKCFENDRKSLLSVVLTKSLFTFLKMRVVLKRSRSKSTGQGQSPMVQCIVISSWISLSIFHN